MLPALALDPDPIAVRNYLYHFGREDSTEVHVTRAVIWQEFPVYPKPGSPDTRVH